MSNNKLEQFEYIRQREAEVRSLLEQVHFDTWSAFSWAGAEIGYDVNKLKAAQAKLQRCIELCEPPATGQQEK